MEEVASILTDRFKLHVDAAATPFIPIEEQDLFLNLAATAARNQAGETHSAHLLLLDRRTLAHLQSENGALPQAAHIGCLQEEFTEPFGELLQSQPPPTSPVAALPESVEAVTLNDDFPAEHYIFLLLSPTVHLLCLGFSEHDRKTGQVHFHGGWSLQREPALALASALLKGPQQSWLPRPEENTALDPPQTTLAMQMMRYQATVNVQRQRAIAKENADIFKVLNSLYTISPHQKAHDILFVFVKQIARVVTTERCSIVQIRGEAPNAYVLASHENIYINGFQLELGKYPELGHALHNKRKVLIAPNHHPDISTNLMETLQQAQISALLVIPMVLHDSQIGSLFLRVAKCSGTFTHQDIHFLNVISEAAGNVLKHAQLFNTIKQDNQHLKHLSRTDGLTGLHNYRFFLEQFEAEFLRATRYKLQLSCVLFDVDDFKAFNDTYGHLLGDAVLQELATRTQNAIRQSDFVARYGGEEFVIILPHTAIEGALVHAERLRKTIAEPSFVFSGTPYNVTISIGVSSLDHGAMQHSEELIRQADAALYKAKSAGKNRVCGPGDL